MIVVAHIDPDPDTVGSALALASALSTYAVIPGGGSPALEVLPLGKLRDLMPSELPEDIDAIALADFHSTSQLMPQLINSKVIAIYDHHADGDITAPISHIDPSLGATCTLVWELTGTPKDPNLALVMLAGIIHDTAGLKLHATDRDIRAAEALARRADANPERLMQEMANAELRNWKPENDFRVYEISGKTIAIGQIRVPGVMGRRDIIQSADTFISDGIWDGSAYLISDPAAGRTLVLAKGILTKLAGTHRLISRKVDFLPMVKEMLKNA